MQNIACVARGEREGVIPRKRHRVSGARKRFLCVSEAKRAANCYQSARLAVRKLTRNAAKR